MDMASLVEIKKNPKIPDITPGDTVRVSSRIVEGGKERIQVFQGVIIKMRRSGASTSFTVRHVAYGIGVERTFPLYSPLMEKVEVVRHGKVRRAKLYYLRGLSGREARRKIKRVERKAKKIGEEVLAPEPEEIVEPLLEAEEEPVLEQEQVQEEGAEEVVEEAQVPEAVKEEPVAEEKPEPEAVLEPEQAEEEVLKEEPVEEEEQVAEPALEKEPEPEPVPEEKKEATLEEPSEQAPVMEKEPEAETALEQEEDQKQEKETS